MSDETLKIDDNGNNVAGGENPSGDIINLRCEEDGTLIIKTN